ncbi:MAG: cupin domain-containing protein [Caldilineaceae bacterium]|nr:cupin domain-containing protein [Caldilineaceae bacterium]
MEAFEYAELREKRRHSGKSYLEFLRYPSMSMGLYELPSDGVDPQQPHAEDEIYYVVRGRAQIYVDGEDRTVGPGSVIFVARGIEHRFHTIEEDLSILVVFAPAESK